MRARGAAWAAACALLLASAAAAPARAEIRRLEVVGAVSADPDDRGDAPLAQAALQDALREAVARVAQGLLVGPDGSVPEFDAAAVLGSDPTDYAVRFRILEDRGERRALLVTEPGVAREYVVLVEAHVDVERVRGRLQAAGLLQGVGPAEGATRFSLEVLELRSARAYTALRRALLDRAGADQVQLRELEPGRALLRVRSGAGAQATVRALEGADLGEGLSVQALPGAASGPVVRMREVPVEAPRDEPAAEEDDPAPAAP